MEDDDEEEFLDLDQMTQKEKYEVLQKLYEEYQLDPENFPEDQREILERELNNFFQEGEGEEEEDGMTEEEYD
jgi:hypothetical protein